MQWNKTKYPGIRYREHDSRKNGVQKDRYFVIRYQHNGKRREEGLGWSSEGWTAEKASLELAHLKKAHTTGQGAESLSEKRTIEKERREKVKAEKARIEKENVTFKEFFENTYQPILETSKSEKSILTEKSYFIQWLEPGIGAVPMRSLSSFHFERIKKNLLEAKRAPRTIQYIFAIVRQVWNMARRHGIVAGDCPTLHVKPPKIDNRRLRFLSLDEAETLLVAVKKRSEQLYNMALLSLKTGMRAGEVFNLKWGHIDFDRGFINIVDTKAGRNRAAYLTSEIKAMLESLYGSGQDQDSFVFTAQKRNRGKEAGSDTDSAEIQVKAISAVFRKIVKDDTTFNLNAKDPRQKVCFHTLRHTFASWLVENGTDLYTVKELMGHSTLAMTERYSHLGENTLQGAVKNLEVALEQKRIEAEKKREEEKQKQLAGA